MTFKKDIFNKLFTKNQKNNDPIIKQILKDNTQLKSNLNDLKIKNKSLYGHFTNSIKEYETTINELNNLNNSLSTQIKNKDTLISKKENKIKQLTNEKTQLQQNNTEKENKKTQLQQNNTEKENKIKQLTNEKTQLQQNNTEKEQLINLINKYTFTTKDSELLEKQLSKFKKLEVINKISKKDYGDLTITIKSPHPKNTTNWGDYFFSLSLKKSFEKLGFNVVIHEKENWYKNKENSDITIVLRGLTNYEPNLSTINILWNISHPSMITINEFEKYDIVFISSIKYANKISAQVNTIVKPLLQCTDPTIFFTEPQEDINDEILFVGMTRHVHRQIIKDALKTNHNISIYGGGWEAYLDKNDIKGQFIPNEELHKYYSSCKILLNDHWEDMKNEDFPSNRLFDALACGTFVISDNIPSAKTIFKDTIITYDNVDDLNKKLDYYLNHEDERKIIAEKGKKLVLKNHTFDHRVIEILKTIKNIDISNF